METAAPKHLPYKSSCQYFGAPWAKSTTLLTIVLAAFGIGCSSESNPTSNDPATIPLTNEQETLSARLSKTVDAAAENGFTGSVLVRVDGTDLLAEGYGLANRNNNAPLTDTTAFDTSTMAMEFTAAAIYKLQEQRLLNVSDPIDSIFPNIPTDKADISLLQLLTHRAGFAESHSNEDIFEPVDRFEARQRIFNQALLFAPGNDVIRSNSGYTLLADVVQEVSGRDFAEYVRTELFTPAGLEQTGFYGDEQWQSGQTAIGYGAETFADNDPANWPYTWASVGNGGLVTSVRDYNRWLTALSDGTVLSASTFNDFQAQRELYLDFGTQQIGGETVDVFGAEGMFGQVSLGFESLGNKTRIIVMSNAEETPFALIRLIENLADDIFNPEPSGELTIASVFENAIENGFSGSVLVRYQGEVLLDSAAGFANRESQTAFATDTVSTMGSLTKQYTGALIMTLQEAGLLDVEDSLSDHFIDVPADKANITIHQLLTHTAGLRVGFGSDYDEIGRDEYLQLVWASPLNSAPGTVYDYSNTGYSIAAAIAETVTGQSYEEALSERVLMPAGLIETGYLLPDWSNRVISTGYRGNNSLPDFGSNWQGDGPTWHLRGNGGLLTTTSDFLKWHDALAGESVLTSESIAQLQAPHVDEGFGDSFYGYGWVTEETPAGTLHWHDGGNGFHFALVYRFVEEDLVIIMLSNEDNEAAGELVPRLAQAASPSLKNW